MGRPTTRFEIFRPRRILWRAMLTVTLIALAAPAAVLGAVPDDAYVAGYAAAILERELKLTAPSLVVRDGVISVAAVDLAGADRAAVTETLRGIRGVRRVEVRDAVAPAALGAPAARAPAAPPRAEALEILPNDLLFRGLVADPRWPHSGASGRHYLGHREFDTHAAVSIGDSVAFVRGPLGEAAQWETGLQAVTFALFDAESADLVNIDFLIAGFLTVRQGPWSAIARVLHSSSHLGDEQVLNRGTNRINLSYEAVDIRLSWEARDWLRLYGGAGYMFRVDPTNYAPWMLQAGTEMRSPWTPWPGVARPILAVDVQSREEHDWQPQLTLRTGIEFEGVKVLGRRAQILFEYGAGKSFDGQFYRRDAEYLGIGVHFHY